MGWARKELGQCGMGEAGRRGGLIKAMSDGGDETCGSAHSLRCMDSRTASLRNQPRRRNEFSSPSIVGCCTW